MSKISLEQLQDVLTESKIEPEKQKEILENLQQIIKEEKENKDVVPRQKSQLGVILLDEKGELRNDNIGALIYEISATQNHDDVMANVRKSATEFNNTKKGQKNPIKSVSEVFAHVKPKILKANGLKRKTKEIVRCLVSNNKI
jgi:hypothetical protein